MKSVSFSKFWNPTVAAVAVSVGSLGFGPPACVDTSSPDATVSSAGAAIYRDDLGTYRSLLTKDAAVRLGDSATMQDLKKRSQGLSLATGTSAVVRRESNRFGSEISRTYSVEVVGTQPTRNFAKEFLDKLVGRSQRWVHVFDVTVVCGVEHVVSSDPWSRMPPGRGPNSPFFNDNDGPTYGPIGPNGSVVAPRMPETPSFQGPVMEESLTCRIDDIR